MLTENHLIQTAERDLRIPGHNSVVNIERGQYKASGASARAAGSKLSTGFLGKHVRHCNKPSEVLRKALAGRMDALKSKDRAVRLLYEDAELLERAAKLAEEYGC